MQNWVIGNWKMNLDIAAATDLAQGIIDYAKQTPQAKLVLCPSFVFLPQIASQLQNSGIGLGAQDVSEYTEGAYTGQISATMLKYCGCGYVIIGHSERRALCGETDAVIVQKCLAAQNAGLVPILCVGETQSEFEAGSTEAVVSRQLEAVLNSNKLNLKEFMLAYEPVWAIGTGLSATTEQAQGVHHLLRGGLARYDAQLATRIPILYGGSVKPSNAQSLFAQADINGALVGGASLNAELFCGIVAAANE